MRTITTRGIIFLISAIFLIEGCKKDENEVAVSKISVSPSQISLKTGETEYLSVAVTPKEAYIKGLKWKSENEEIATIDNNGMLYGKAGGETDVVVTTLDGKHSSICKVTVGDDKDMNIYVDSVRLNHNKLVMSLGTTEQLIAEVYPKNATNKTLTWMNLNLDVISLKENGSIYAQNVGTSKITVIANSGGKFDTCFIRVIKVDVESVELDVHNIQINVGESEKLNYTIYPENASNKNVKWDTEDKTIVTVENGTLKGISPGSTTVTITTDDQKKTDICEVTVVQPVTGVSLEQEKLLFQGKTADMKATVHPADATNKDIVWTTDNSAVRVTNGVVTATKSSGGANITVKTVDGDFTASVYVPILTPENNIIPTYSDYNAKIKGEPYADNYKAFDGSDFSYWVNSTYTDPWIAYEFADKQYVNYYELSFLTVSGTKTIELIGINSSTDTQVLDTRTVTSGTWAFEIDNTKAYKTYKVRFVGALDMKLGEFNVSLVE